VVLSWRSSPGSPVLVDLACQSCSGCSGLAVLLRHYCPDDLLWQSCPVCHLLPAPTCMPVLPVSLCLSHSACPVVPVPLCQSCSACPALPALFCLSCAACPVLVVPFWLSCPSYDDCPFWLSFFWLSFFCPSFFFGCPFSGTCPGHPVLVFLSALAILPCSMETWTCSMDNQHGHTACKCSMVMQHDHAAWTCSKDMHQKLAAEIQHGKAAWTCSMETWTCGMSMMHVQACIRIMYMWHAHAALSCNMDMQHVLAAWSCNMAM
jgi:hypothetical protein